MDIYVQQTGQKLGPFSEAKIRESIDAGKFTPSDLAWTAGKASWQPLATLLHLDLAQPPPVDDGHQTEVVRPTVMPPEPSQGTVKAPKSVHVNASQLFDDADESLRTVLLKNDRTLSSQRIRISKAKIIVGDEIYILSNVAHVAGPYEQRRPTHTDQLSRARFAGIATLIILWITYAVTFGRPAANSVWNFEIVGIAFLLCILALVTLCLALYFWAEYEKGMYRAIRMHISGPNLDENILIGEIPVMMSSINHRQEAGELSSEQIEFLYKRMNERVEAITTAIRSAVNP